MKRVWKYTCGLSLGLLTSASGWAQEIQWHAATRPSAATPAPQPANELPPLVCQPIATSVPPAALAGAVSLGTPVAVGGKGTSVQPVACSTPATADGDKVAVNKQPFEAPQPMPVGPTPAVPNGAEMKDSLKMPTPLPGPVPPPGVPVQPGMVVPPGTVIPPGTVVPQETVVPPGAVEVQPGTELAPGSEVPAEETVPPGAEMAPGTTCTGPGCCADDGSGDGGDGGLEGLPEGSCVVESDATADGHVKGGHAHLHSGWQHWRDRFGGSGGDDGDGWTWGHPEEDNSFYVNAEYLLWFTKGNSTPPLVTGSAVRGVGAGSLGDPNALVLYGNGRVDTGTFSGGRFTAGYWFDQDHSLGLEGSFFFIGPNTQSFFIGSNSGTAIFRPFTNENLGTADAIRVAYPGFRAGSIAIDEQTRLWGYEVNAKTSLLDDSLWRLNLLGGFRSIGLDQSTQITTAQTLINSGGTTLSSDRFATQNRFYGGQVGLEAGTNWGPWSFDVKGKVALGETNQIVDITGATLLNRGQGAQLVPVGVLAGASNIGHYSHTAFGVVPEVGLTIGYQINDNVRVYAGYTLLYMSNVALSGSQINPTLNVNQLPPGLVRRVPATAPPQPAFTFRTQDFWAQGANIGVEFRY